MGKKNKSEFEQLDLCNQMSAQNLDKLLQTTL